MKSLKSKNYGFSRTTFYCIKSGAGFTLIEVIMAVALAFVVLLMIYDIYILSQKTFRFSDERLEILQNGRIVLDRLSREIRQTPEAVTPLPATKSEIGFPAPEEIEFQDGHDLSIIQYLKYFLSNGLLQRQRIVYWFSDEPDNYVVWSARDEFGQPPQSTILEERTIAEYLDNLIFYGSSTINIEVWLKRGETGEHLLTSVWGRNTRN